LHITHAAFDASKARSSAFKSTDPSVSDRLLETCKQIGDILITKDKGQATKTEQKKIPVFLIKPYEPGKEDVN
jgi:rRNA-processing protein FCF1